MNRRTWACMVSLFASFFTHGPSVFLTGLVISVVFLVAIAAKSTGLSRVVRSQEDVLSPVPWWKLAVLTGGLFAFHYLLGRQMFGSWYFQDDAFDSCVMPLQFKLNEPIWGGGTAYLVYWLYLLAYEALGFGLHVAIALNVLVFSVSSAVCFAAIRSALGNTPAWLFLTITNISYPFVLHSTYATAITFGVLAPAVTFAVLLHRERMVDLRAAAVLSMVLAASFYMYPGGSLACVCLIAAHFAFFHRRWGRYGLAKVAAVFFGAALLVIGSRRLISTGSFISSLGYWAGGQLRVERAWEGAVLSIQDTFWRSTTWNTLNHQAPYFEIQFAGLLIIAAVLGVRLCREPWGQFEGKWALVCVGVFLGNSALVGVTGTYPGVRRALWSLFLLYVSVGIGAGYLLRIASARRLTQSLLLLGVLFAAAHTTAMGITTWPFSTSSRFVTELRGLITRPELGRRRALLVGYAKDQFRSQHVRCTIALDERLKGFVSEVHVIVEEDLNQPHLIARIMAGQEALVFATNEKFSDERLTRIFGRMPSKSYLFRNREGVHLDGLIAAYIYETKEQESQP